MVSSYLLLGRVGQSRFFNLALIHPAISICQEKGPAVAARECVAVDDGNAKRSPVYMSQRTGEASELLPLRGREMRLPSFAP